MLDIHKLMNTLAAERPIFHSRKDFHSSIVETLTRIHPGCGVVPEFNHLEDDQSQLNVWVPALAAEIRLRYATGYIRTHRQHESFALRHQGAQDRGRYSFLRDVERIERVVSEIPNVRSGVAVLLTNDHLYWQPPTKLDPVDIDFRVHDGTILSGTLNWTEEASEGTKESMDQPIVLQGAYEMEWRNYSDLRLDKNSQFRYLAIEVRK